jgi:hypothetical protein
MCREAISLIAEALNGVQTADVLLKVERVIAHFMQTMEVGLYPRPSHISTDRFESPRHGTIRYPPLIPSC